MTVPLSAAQDVLTIGNGTSCQVYPVGTTVVTVPVYIRDVTGTPLGRDKPGGKKLQAFSLQVTPNPASKIAVDASGSLRIYPAQAGLTSGLSPTYSNNTNNTFASSWAIQFAESNPILFNQSAPAPGNLVGNLTVHLKSGLPAGTRIDLLLSADYKVTLFSNAGGTTSESTANGQMAIVHSCIQIGSGGGGPLPSGASMTLEAPSTGEVFVSPDVVAAIDADGEANVMVELADPVLPGAPTAQFRAENIRVRDEVLAGLGTDLRVRHRYEHVPGFAGRINRGGLNRLKSNPWVRSVTFDYPIEPAACEAKGAMNIGLSGTGSLTGAGVTIALLDTGIDVTLDALEGVSKAELCANGSQSSGCTSLPICSSRGLPGIPNCPANVSQRTAHDGTHGHGTLMAGVIASQSTCGVGGQCPPPIFNAPFMRGVAPNASLVPVRLFNLTDNFATDEAVISDLLRGLDLIDIHQNVLGIDIVSMSLNLTLEYLPPGSNHCDYLSPNVSRQFRNLRDKYGIGFLASSGNHGNSTQITAPACFKDVVAVGAVYDAVYASPQPVYGSWSSAVPAETDCRLAEDPLLPEAGCQDLGTIDTNRIPCFSNSSQFVRLLAPGAWINSTVTGLYAGYGGSTSEFSELAGTSFSSALAAAAAALVVEATGVSGQDAVSHLWSTARHAGASSILDTRNNVTSRKADVPAAIAAHNQKLYNLDRGDATGDFSKSVGDVFFLINYLFSPPLPMDQDQCPPPNDPVLCASFSAVPRTSWGGDANCDGATTVADIFFMIEHFFAGGPAPGTGCNL